jgi:dTDP-4-amino-4,6-dideoxygalactose transaminase
MSAAQTRQIPVLDLTPEVNSLWPEISAALERTIRSGMFINGPETRSLEAELAAFLGVKHVVGMNSGTDALMIALRAAGVKPGDEVITSPFSFFATAESISNIGATPVFVDVDLESMNMDPSLIEAAITEKTTAIMPVHIFGRPAAMAQIMALAEKHGLKVIEDAAQSIGARYEGGCSGCEGSCSRQGLGQFTGAIGHAGAFSMYPTKNFGAYGDAGFLTTQDDAIARTAKMLRDHGSEKRYHNEMLGYNSRLDSIQAAILRVKLPHLARYNERRRTIAAKYNELLQDVDGLITPAVTPGHVFHQYTVRITSQERDAVQASLRERGVGSMVYYPIPQSRLPVYAGQYPPYEKSELLASQVLSLPIWPQMEEEVQAAVAEALKASIAS